MTKTESSPSEYFPNFDILRLLLALEVVVAHLYLFSTPNTAWNAWVMAVPSFLAISGVVVLKSYSEKVSLKDFAKRRALRILPALSASVLLIFILFDSQVALNAITTWLSGGIYIPEKGYTNQALWSLAWEELAYLILAGLWAVGAYQKPRFIWLALVASAVTVYVFSASRFDPLTITLAMLAQAFFAGNLAFIYRKKLHVFGRFAPWAFLAFTILAPHLPVRQLLQAMAIVWVGIAGFRIIGFRTPDISYGVYIYHVPILLFITEKCQITDIQSASWILMSVLIPTCLASWYFIERPCIRYKRRKKINEANAVAQPFA
ncbi:acyltransferase [Pseudomonas sp. PB103]|uniref:acyltransferase family protein n=1 Tax=Pseudomonas sp. PB103 TaxID=2494698 RepID=UPI00131AE6BC|nr:acyltransferase [Pseudomonas sp. PB103]